MELRRALDQISEIHGQLAKGEVYKSYKSFPVAVSGMLAVIVATFQPKWIGAERPLAFVGLWASTAVLSLLMAGSVILYNYLVHEGPVARRTTRRVVGQFVPAVGGGALVTAAVVLTDPARVEMLPGFWALLFGMGVFASRPYLPRAVGWVALYYLVAGSGLLALAADGSSLSPWGMGATFGAGQFLAAFVLYWNLERRDHG